MEKWQSDAIDLKQRIAGVNNWIKANPQEKNPNMEEYTRLFVECGEVYREACEYYNEKGYPTIKDENGNERSADHYDLMWIPALRAIRDELETLSALRKLHTSDENSFTSIPCVRNFYQEMFQKVYCGEYMLPENEEMKTTKKDILRQCMNVSFYIWNTQRNEPGYVYDNKTEFEELKEMYNNYVKSEGIQESRSGEGIKPYEGPQFGRVIEGMFDYINKNYLYSEERVNGETVEEKADKSVSENKAMEKWQADAIELKKRIAGVNNWIKANPQEKNPNMEEYTRLFVECGEVYREACEYFSKNGYPTIKDENGNERVADHYDLMWIPELKEVRDELETLAALRKLHTSDENSFTSIPCVKNFYQELFQRTYCGEYMIPEDEKLKTIKKDILRQCMNVSFYIWNTQRNEPGYIYDNKNEFEELVNMYDYYTKSSDKVVSHGDGNGNFDEYAQFGPQIEAMIDYINKSYLYAEENTNTKVK